MYGFLGVLLLITVSLTVSAQEISVAAEVNRTRVTLDETLILTITVSGSDLGDVAAPVLPDMRGFNIIGSTSSSSTSFNLVNGKLSSSRTVRFIYQLKPRDTGSFVIGASEVTHDGETHETTPISIEVTPGAAGTASPGRSRIAPPGSPQAAPSSPSQGAEVRPDLGDAVYVRATLDKSRVYLGEQVTVDYTLYTRLGLTNARYDVVPSYTGFWLEELFTAHHLDFMEEIIGGKRYAVTKLRQIALFPTVTGELKIEPLSMICDVQAERSRRSLLDGFLNDPFDTFFSTTRQIRVASEGQSVTVLPLPSEGRPPGFGNAVGDFSLKATVDLDTTEVNQPVTLTIVLSGEGNLRTVADPVLPPLDYFKEYQSGTNAEFESGGRRMSGTKTWEHVLIPTTPGEHIITSLSFPYFNPDIDAYRVSTTDSIAVTVLSTGGEQAAVAGIPRKTIVRQLRQDIQYIKPETVFLGDQGEVLFRSAWYLLLHILPVAAVLATMYYRSHARRLRDDAGYARWRRADSNARSVLRQSRQKLEQGAFDQAFSGISSAIYGYIADKCNQPAAGLTSPRVVELLGDRGVDDVTVSLVKDCLDACDMARFAPTALTAEHTEDVLGKALKALESIEPQLMEER